METNEMLSAEGWKKTLKNPITLVLVILTVLITVRVVYQRRKTGKATKDVLNEDLKYLSSPTFIVSAMGTVTGVGEALIYYNLGQSAGDKFQFKVPPKEELFKTLSVVVVSSIITGLLTELVLKMLPEAKEKELARLQAKKGNIEITPKA